MTTYIGKSSAGQVLITHNQPSLLDAAIALEQRLPPGQWLDGVCPLTAAETARPRASGQHLPMARRAG